MKAHRTKREKEHVTKFERFVTEGKETADDLAKKTGASLDEGSMAEVRADTLQQGREEVYAALQYAARFHCFVDQWKDCEELKPTGGVKDTKEMSHFEKVRHRRQREGG